MYRISSGLHEKEDAVQIATIQSFLGTKARRVLKTLPNIPKDITARTVAGIFFNLTALETYCAPRKNTTYERYVSRMTMQEGRTFDIFVTDLRRRVEYCDFGALNKDSLIRDQIVVGISDPKLRERLLWEKNSRKPLTYAESRNNRKYSARQQLQRVVLILLRRNGRRSKQRRKPAENNQMQILRSVSRQRKLSSIWSHVL